MFSDYQLLRLIRYCNSHLSFVPSLFCILLTQDESSCLGIKLASKVATEIKFSDVYAVELINEGLVHESNIPNARRCLAAQDDEVHSRSCSFYVLEVHIWQLFQKRQIDLL